ncbi:hypothetical protein NHQ30_002979 [Ciborinia camelliae]|nr:hypothetical protein NHQ30_002979 [Ciborinia camelliae]
MLPIIMATVCVPDDNSLSTTSLVHGDDGVASSDGDSSDAGGSTAELVHDDDSVASSDDHSSDLGDFTAELLENAIRDNNLDELKRLLDSRDDLLEILMDYEFTENGQTVMLNVTALHLAAALSESSIVELLLEHNADVHAHIPLIGGTVLHLAARYGPKASMDRLLSRCPNVDQEDQDGSSPLHLACRYGRKDTVACLLDASANYSLRDNSGNTAFHTASMYGRLEILRLLWERGSQKHINAKNNHLNAPLHLASLNEHDDTVKWLLSSGAEIDQPGQGGNSPLSLACGDGKTKSVAILLEEGADIHKVNNYFNTPILIACINANLAIFRMLRKHGASVSDADTRYKNTCFHMAIINNQVFSDALRCIFDDLVGAGANINQPNIYGFPPLYSACLEQRPKHLEYLLDLGADINQKTIHEGTTVLMEACCKQDNQVVKLLLQRKADMTITNHHGLTALALACNKKEPDHVKALISNGADVTVRDREGITPLRAAVVGHDDIEIVLEILATENYYPRNPAVSCSTDRRDEIPDIEAGLLKGLGNDIFKSLEKLQIVMYWAVFNGALALTRKCIDHNQQVLQWNREGATWLHIASYNGMFEITEFLLGMISNPPWQPEHLEQPEQLELAARWAKVEAIIEQNSRAEGIISWKSCFGLKLDNFNPSTKASDSYPEAADRILELLARYEKPGHEDILTEFLRVCIEEDGKDQKDFTTLHWAVCGSRAVVVWWLLSKGGYSSSGAIERALSLVEGPYENNDVRFHIRELLLHPPPMLDHVANPNKNHTPTFPINVKHMPDPAPHSRGNIVDILSDGETISIPYDNPSIHRIIYGEGPESLMRTAREDLRQRDLYLLKKALRQTTFERGGKDYKLFPSSSRAPQSNFFHPAESTSSGYYQDKNEEFSSGTSRELRLRWIHLPVNELHLLQDLVSRLSHDSNRSEIEHMALMKHFNRSWTELAAGAGHYYMKPQFVQKQNIHTEHPNNDINGSGAPRESNNVPYTALYMPYLTVGSYTPKNKPVPSVPTTVFDESIDRRNSKYIKHMPMTLDQYYYPTIMDTSERDNDQVLSKFLQRKHEQGSKSQGTEKKILKINQLWVWIIDEKTIITATTEDPNQESPKNIDRESPGNLLQTALRNILYGEAKGRFERATSVHSVMELILSVATGFFVEKSVAVPNQNPKGPIEIFRESIRDVADQETSLFRDFLGGLREAEKQKGHLPSEDSSSKSSDKPTSSNRYHVISSETELLDTIRDLRDELHILRSLAEDQEIVWKQAFTSNDLMNFESYTPTDAKKELDDMLSEADKTDNYINTLLDLRQAEFGRLQAYDSARQSNIGATAIVSVPAIILAWNVNAISGKFRPRNNIESIIRSVSTSVENKPVPRQGTKSTWGKHLRRRLRRQDNNAVLLHEGP